MKRYLFIDGLRGIAVYWVIFHHLFWQFDTRILFGNMYVFLKTHFPLDLLSELQVTHHWMQRVAVCGNIGVDMFFVMSGFLITGLLLRNFDHGVSIKRFYIRRFFKIAPQYLLAVSVALFLYIQFPPAINGIVPDPAFVTNPWGYIFMLQNYFISIPSLEHTWSLVIEEQFYIFYPLIMLMVFTYFGSRKNVLIYLCLFTLLLGNLIRFFFFDTGLPFLRESPFHPQTTLFRMDALAMGCLLKFLERFFNSDKSWWKIVTPVCFISSIGIYWLFIKGELSVGGFAHDSWFAYTLAYIAPALLFIAGYRGFFPVKCIAENPLLMRLGKYSYGIYLWHYILIYPATMLVPYYGILTSIGIYLIAATLVGAGTTITVERYFLRVRDAIFPFQAQQAPRKAELQSV